MVTGDGKPVDLAECQPSPKGVYTFHGPTRLDRRAAYLGQPRRRCY